MIRCFRDKSFSFENEKRFYNSLSSLDQFTILHNLTFEDWKNGNIPFPPPTYDRVKEKYKSNPYLFKPGLWPHYWAITNEPSMMKQSELDKIQEEQERVFKRAVEFTVKCFVLHYKEGLKYMSPKEQHVYQRNEKARIKNKLDNDRDNQAKMLRGAIPWGKLDNYTCDIILETIQLFKHAEKMGGTFLGGNGYLFESDLDDLYKTYVHYQYLNELMSEGNESTNDKLTEKQKLSIQSFADQKKNKDICIKILQIFERNRDTLGGISLSASLRRIKVLGDFKNLNLPSDKTLRGWIRDYKSYSQNR